MNWITIEYDDYGEIVNPEFTDAEPDSYWWVDSVNMNHKVLTKTAIQSNRYWPRRIAFVKHPDDV